MITDQRIDEELLCKLIIRAVKRTDTCNPWIIMGPEVHNKKGARIPQAGTQCRVPTHPSTKYNRNIGILCRKL